MIWMFQNLILNQRNQNLGAKKDLFWRKMRQTTFGCLSARRSRKVIRNKKIVSIGQPSQKLWPFKVFQAKKHKLFIHVSKSRPRRSDLCPRKQIALTWTRCPDTYPDIVLTWTRFHGKWPIPVNNQKIGPFR